MYEIPPNGANDFATPLNGARFPFFAPKTDPPLPVSVRFIRRPLRDHTISGLGGMFFFTFTGFAEIDVPVDARARALIRPRFCHFLRKKNTFWAEIFQKKSYYFALINRGKPGSTLNVGGGG